MEIEDTVKIILRTELISFLNQAKTEGIDVFADPQASLDALSKQLGRVGLFASLKGDHDLAWYLSFRGVSHITRCFDAKGYAAGFMGWDIAPTDEYHELSYIIGPESCAPTICFDHSEKVFFVDSWGNWDERRIPSVFALDTEMRGIEGEIAAMVSQPARSISM